MGIIKESQVTPGTITSLTSSERQVANALASSCGLAISDATKKISSDPASLTDACAKATDLITSADKGLPLAMDITDGVITLSAGISLMSLLSESEISALISNIHSVLAVPVCSQLRNLAKIELNEHYYNMTAQEYKDKLDDLVDDAYIKFYMRLPEFRQQKGTEKMSITTFLRTLIRTVSGEKHGDRVHRELKTIIEELQDSSSTVDYETIKKVYDQKYSRPISIKSIKNHLLHYQHGPLLYFEDLAYTSEDGRIESFDIEDKQNVDPYSQIQTDDYDELYAEKMRALFFKYLSNFSTTEKIICATRIYSEYGPLPLNSKYITSDEALIQNPKFIALLKAGSSLHKKVPETITPQYIKTLRKDTFSKLSAFYARITGFGDKYGRGNHRLVMSEKNSNREQELQGKNLSYLMPLLQQVIDELDELLSY